MAIRDLIPWSGVGDVTVRRGDPLDPVISLHRQMNRVLDDVFRDFDLAPLGAAERFL
jgi:HSP20 family protein